MYGRAHSRISHLPRLLQTHPFPSALYIFCRSFLVFILLFFFIVRAGGVVNRRIVGKTNGARLAPSRFRRADQSKMRRVDADPRRAYVCTRGGRGEHEDSGWEGGRREGAFNHARHCQSRLPSSASSSSSPSPVPSTFLVFFFVISRLTPTDSILHFFLFFIGRGFTRQALVPQRKSSYSLTLLSCNYLL